MTENCHDKVQEDKGTYISKGIHLYVNKTNKDYFGLFWISF